MGLSSVVVGFLCFTQARAQTIGNWSIARNDAGHAGWQKAESKISKDTLSSQFKFLWKIKLGTAGKDTLSYSEPLLVLRLINARGFKDLVVWAGTEDLYAVDSELGTMVWTKHFDVKPSACGATNLGSVMEAPPTINFGARRAPGTPPPPPPAPMAESARRVGVSPGGGGFGLRGIYVLTGDGYLHEQVLATGADFAPAVKFLPGPAGISTGLSLNGKVLYTATTAGCTGTQNAYWSINLSSADYPVSSYSTKGVPPLVAMGPTIGGDGIAYVVTGEGAAGSSESVYANSIIALTPDAKVKDWYTPSGEGKLENVTPVFFTSKQKKLVAAPGKDGSFVLLDSESLGGPDHRTPLAATQPIFKSKSDSASALANWKEADGTDWILASVPGSVSPGVKFANSNGPAPHGSVVAFKIEDANGKTILAPAWISRDLINPAPPVIANGLVIVLSQGNATTHAQLFVLDGETGKELYSSGDAIGTYAHLAGVSVGDGHAFFVTHDNTLYSFGIGMEH